MRLRLIPLLLLQTVHASTSCMGAGGEPTVLTVGASQAFATLSAAMTAAESSTGDIEIRLAAGDHDLSQESVEVTWDHDCERRLTITGATGGGEVRILGGVPVSHSALTSDDPAYSAIPAGARASVRVAVLDGVQLGLTGQLTSVEGEPVEFLKVSEEVAYANMPLEPFLGRTPLWSAQWPNRIASPPENTTNYAWTRVAGPPTTDSTSADTQQIAFPHLSSAPFGAWSDWDDVYAQGFWEVDWIEAFLPVSLDSRADHLELTFPVGGGEGEMQSVSEGSRFAVLNSFDSLDAPSEYVLKRNPLSGASDSPSAASGARLYFIPPAEHAGASTELIVSTNSDPLISLSQVRGVTISHLTFEGTRGAVMAISDSCDVEVVHIVCNNVGTNGVEDGSGTNIHVNRSVFTNMGRRAVSLSGGNRAALTPSGNVIGHNEVSRSPRRSLHYGEAFDLGGVAVVATSNLVYNSPCATFELVGNDHVIEYNTIHHVALDSFDTGAIHWAAYSPASWGFLIRHNLLAYVGYKDNACSASTSCMVAGIYAGGEDSASIL